MEEAIAAYREAIRFQPDYAAPHFNLGDALRRQGKCDEAAAAFRAARACAQPSSELARLIEQALAGG